MPQATCLAGLRSWGLNPECLLKSLYSPILLQRCFDVLLCSHIIIGGWAVLSRTKECLVTKSCPTLCNSIDCSLPGSSVHGDSPGRNTGVDCHALLQGIFLTQASNPHLLCLLHRRQILYPLSHLGSPFEIYEYTKSTLGTH